MAIEKVAAFKTSDGSMFDTFAEAESHDDRERLEVVVRDWVLKYVRKEPGFIDVMHDLLEYGHEIGVTIENIDDLAGRPAEAHTVTTYDKASDTFRTSEAQS